MASLKEVKTRISTVNSTRKITSAMKMVASSKLHRAQQVIENMRPYETSLNKMMSTFVSSMEGDLSSPYATKREVKRAAIVVYTSNSSLCGGFNGNAIKALRKAVERYHNAGVTITHICPIGKKGMEAARKLGFTEAQDYSRLLEHTSYEKTAEIAKDLMRQYAEGEVDEVIMIYHHFKSAATQVLTEEPFLPIGLDSTAEQAATDGPALDYIIEPSKAEIVSQLIPKALCLKLYAALLDSLASEHAARIIAMQVATDNADDLLRELTLMYNKTRQQAITTELLDIVGGSMQ